MFWALTAAIMATFALPEAARAVSQAGAIVDTFHPSARGAAMADAFGPVATGPFAIWWNPAGLALEQPVSVGATYNKLAAGLADDVDIWHAGGTVNFGAFGFGGYYARLDYGEQQSSGGVDPEPVVSTFDSHESSFRIGGAVELVSLFDLDTGSNEVDLAIGADLKRLHVNFELPPEVTQDLGSGGGAIEATSWTMDAGALFRLGRFFSIDAAGSNGLSYLGLRASVVYDGLIEADLQYADADQSDPIPTSLRVGFALEAKLSPTATVGELVKIILAYERFDSRVPLDDIQIDRRAIEVCVANTLILRGGSYEDPERNIVNGTFGAGLRLHRPGWKAGLQLDYANFPQSQGLERVHLFTVTGGFDRFK
jgi:hypothetical protein